MAELNKITLPWNKHPTFSNFKKTHEGELTRGWYCFFAGQHIVYIGLVGRNRSQNTFWKRIYDDGRSAHDKDGKKWPKHHYRDGKLKLKVSNQKLKKVKLATCSIHSTNLPNYKKTPRPRRNTRDQSKYIEDIEKILIYGFSIKHKYGNDPSKIIGQKIVSAQKIYSLEDKLMSNNKRITFPKGCTMINKNETCLNDTKKNPGTIVTAKGDLRLNTKKISVRCTGLPGVSTSFFKNYYNPKVDLREYNSMKLNSKSISVATKKTTSKKKVPAKKGPVKKSPAKTSGKSRSAAAKKAAATRKRNEADKKKKRSDAAKKAAATRKRNAAAKKATAKKSSSKATRRKNICGKCRRKGHNVRTCKK